MIPSFDFEASAAQCSASGEMARESKGDSNAVASMALREKRMAIFQGHKIAKSLGVTRIADRLDSRLKVLSTSKATDLEDYMRAIMQRAATGQQPRWPGSSAGDRVKLNSSLRQRMGCFATRWRMFVQLRELLGSTSAFCLCSDYTSALSNLAPTMSLADSLLADLDGLSDEEPEVAPSAQAGPSKPSGFGSMLPPPVPVKALKRPFVKEEEDVKPKIARFEQNGNGHTNGDGDSDEDMDEEAEARVGFVPEGGVRPADELDAEEVEKADMTGIEDVSKVARLIHGTKLQEVLKVSTAMIRLKSNGCIDCGTQEIEKYISAPTDMSSKTGGALSENPEYSLVVTANNMSVEVDNEILLVHKFIRDHYAPRFPELEQLIADPWTYIAAVNAIGNADDLTKCKMPSTLPPATILSITLTATSTRGRKLSPGEWITVQNAIQVAEQLRTARETIFNYVESRMSNVAPNLSVIVGTNIAAKLLGLAGGLQSFCRQPSSNIMLFGAQKKTLANSAFSAASQQRHTGFIFQSQLVQSAQPEDRRKAQRAVSAKCTLAARIDASKSSRDGEAGRKLLGELQKKIQKMAEPPPNKMVKALPVPQETNRKKRGGKR